MLFNSYIFVFVFLPLILLLRWCPGISTKIRLGLLVIASYIFYGWWDYRFVALLVFSTVVDYYAGQKIHEAKQATRRGLWLSFSLVINLGVLAFFKYSGFFASSINAVIEWIRIGGSIPVPDIILPVGISFYTFQTISYSIDIYRRNARPTDSLWHFAAYVSLFPQLIAGPIIRYEFFEDQLRNISKWISWEQFSRGILFFTVGMAQKILLADSIASRINPQLLDYEQLQFAGSWFAMLGYTVQLYFDFAGYSNMAVGLGLMLGFTFPQNFDSPYQSTNIAQFWRRWHMTLSSWLRDYLFIPLGGNRFGSCRTLRNLIIVMFLGGLWHGAGWTFVLWGLFHGVLLASHATLVRKSSIKIPALLGGVATFLCVVCGWVLFRSTDTGMVVELFASMLGIRGLEENWVAACGGATSLMLLWALLALIFVAPNIWQIKLRPSIPFAITLSTMFVLCVLRFDADSPFLYFQF